MTTTTGRIRPKHRSQRAFGETLADFEAIRFKLADMSTEIAAAELMTLRAAYLKEAGRPFTSEASMAKVFASEMSQRACSQAVQIHGGYGYTDEFPVERFMRDARATTLYEGSGRPVLDRPGDGQERGNPPHAGRSGPHRLPGSTRRELRTPSWYRRKIEL